MESTDPPIDVTWHRLKGQVESARLCCERSAEEAIARWYRDGSGEALATAEEELERAERALVDYEALLANPNYGAW